MNPIGLTPLDASQKFPTFGKVVLSSEGSMPNQMASSAKYSSQDVVGINTPPPTSKLVPKAKLG